jgi:hypothetical protein
VKKSQPFKERRTSIRFPVFGYTVYVVFTTDMERTVTSIPRIKGADTKDAAALHVSVAGKPWSYLVFKYKPTCHEIAHESWHAVRRMLLEWTEVGLNDEAVAYHLGYMATKLKDFYFRQKKKGGKRCPAMSTSAATDTLPNAS